MGNAPMLRALLLCGLSAVPGGWTAAALRPHTLARAGVVQQFLQTHGPTEPSPDVPTTEVLPPILDDVRTDRDRPHPPAPVELAGPAAAEPPSLSLPLSASLLDIRAPGGHTTKASVRAASLERDRSLQALPRSSVDPLTDDDFARLPANGAYDARFRSLFDKLSSGESVRIVVLGGSFTAGVECSEPAAGGPITLFQCSWPSRLQAALSELFPKGNISVVNMAHGGATSSVILGAISLLLRGVEGGLGKIDLIMLDTLVNDAVEYYRWTDHGNLPPGEVVRTSFEALVRVLHEMAPQAALVPLLAGCPACLDMAANQRAVASFYNLPLVDYASLVTRKLEELPVLWNPQLSHPHWKSHQIVADVIAATWAKAFRRFRMGAHAPQPTFPLHTLVAPAQLAQFKTCKSGASEYYAEKKDGPHPTIVRGWRLFEDRPGKPGWISEQPGAVLKFRLAFGDEPKLLFTFLRSYEHIGSASLEMNGKLAIVEGLDTTHNVSQSHTQWFDASVTTSQSSHLGEGGQTGFCIKPNSHNVVLTVTAPGAKFKIISVVSC